MEKRDEVIRARVNKTEAKALRYTAKRLGLRISDTIRFVLWEMYNRLKREE